MSKTPEVDAEIAHNKQREAQEKNGIAREEANRQRSWQRQQSEDGHARGLQNELDHQGSIERSRNR